VAVWAPLWETDSLRTGLGVASYSLPVGSRGRRRRRGSRGRRRGQERTFCQKAADTPYAPGNTARQGCRALIQRTMHNAPCTNAASSFALPVPSSGEVLGSSTVISWLELPLLDLKNAIVCVLVSLSVCKFHGSRKNFRFYWYRVWILHC